MNKEVILIVEDDPDILEVLSLYVENSGYRTLKATTIEQSLRCIQSEQLDLILIDVNLPDGSGFDLAQQIREQTDAILMFVTANDTIEHKLKGFDVGADDYITKPFIPKEVMARIQAHLKRKVSVRKVEVFAMSNLRINFDEKTVYKNDEIVHLFTKEKQILFYLVEHANKVLSVEQIINHVWGIDGVADARAVSVHMSMLRRKIEDNPAKPQIIQTVRGFGYKLVL